MLPNCCTAIKLPLRRTLVRLPVTQQCGVLKIYTAGYRSVFSA